MQQEGFNSSLLLCLNEGSIFTVMAGWYLNIISGFVSGNVDSKQTSDWVSDGTQAQEVLLSIIQLKNSLQLLT